MKKYELKKVFQYFDIEVAGKDNWLGDQQYHNGGFIKFYVEESIDESEDADAINKWLLSNGAEAGESVLIEVSW